MTWTNRRHIAAFCTVALVVGTTNTSRAGCCLTDWLFGKGQTTYTTPYAPPAVYAPPPQACGCAPAVQCAPACASVVPAASYRIAYRPVPTVTYMPVTSLDPCSGCAVTTYQPTRTWTYYGSLVPYRVGYAAPVCAGCSGCSSCPGAPPSGYSSCGCSSCGCGSCVAPSSGCSACGTSVVGSYVGAGGCSSCGVGGTVLPGPAEMSQPPAAAPMTVSPSLPATLGPPATAPVAPETGRTYSPGAIGPVAPGAPAPATSGGTPTGGTSGDSRAFRLPTATDAGRTLEPQIQGVPPVITGPQLNSTPAPPASGSRPEGSDRMTSRPSYFQLLTSPPKTVPAQTVGRPSSSASLPADDGGWVHVKP